MILLDTNVLSEALKPAPSARVIAWLDIHFGECALSSIALFELKSGVALLDAGLRRDRLQRAVDRMAGRFGGRLFAFDARAAESAARILALTRTKGLPLYQTQKLADLQIAGIAAAYDLGLATRNVRDFRGTGLSLIDPWNAI
jgi:hypothetical protein